MQKMPEMWIWSLDQEDLLEEEMATCSIILALKIPRTEEPGGPQSLGTQRGRHNWVTEHTQTHTHNLLWSFVFCLICCFYFCFLVRWLHFLPLEKLHFIGDLLCIPGATPLWLPARRSRGTSCIGFMSSSVVVSWLLRAISQVWLAPVWLIAKLCLARILTVADGWGWVMRQLTAASQGAQG